MILQNIAQKVSEDTSKIIGYPVSISDENGYLIGVTDQERIGLYDNLLAEVLRTQKITYWNEDADRPKNIFPGVAAPIIVNDEILGTVGVLGKTGNNPETTSYVKLVKNHIEMLCHETIKKEIRSFKTSAIDTLIHYILNYTENDKSKIQIDRYGEMFGFDLNINRICVIIKINHLPTSTETDQMLADNTRIFIIEKIFNIFKNNKQDLIGRINLNEFILFKVTNTRYATEEEMKQLERKVIELNNMLQSKQDIIATAFIGDVQSSIEGLNLSYNNALKVMSSSNNPFNNTKTIYNFNDFGIQTEILINNSKNKIIKDLKTSLFNFINQDEFKILSKTFIIYCENKFNLSSTSRNMFIHRNTLIYRLRKISKKTKIDLDNFKHCLLLYFVLKN